MHNSIRVVALRVRNTEIIITGTSPTSATTFGNLVTVRLDHGWQTKGFHWPCMLSQVGSSKSRQSRSKLQPWPLSLSTNIRSFQNTERFRHTSQNQIANLHTLCMCKQLVRRESNLQDLSCFQPQKKPCPFSDALRKRLVMNPL